MIIQRGQLKDMNYSFFDTKESIQAQTIKAYFKAISNVGQSEAVIVTPKKSGDGVTVEYFNKIISGYLNKKYIIRNTGTAYDGLTCRIMPYSNKKKVVIAKTGDTITLETGDVCVVADRLKVELKPVNQQKVSNRVYDFYEGAKVIQRENDYSYKKVVNGEIGTLRQIRRDESFTVDFGEGKIPTYRTGEERQIELAYALSGHSYQGSQAKYVIVAFDMASYVLLSKEWLYTAVTRGEKMTYVIANKKAFDIAVKTTHTKRNTWLKKIISDLKILLTL